jgi:L-amino acid N-acyltransferase YncA
MANTTAPALTTFRHIVTLKDGVRVLFRPLTPDDRDGLLRLFVPLNPEDRTSVRDDITEEVVHSWIERLDYDHVLPIVAEVHGEIIGEGTLHYGKGAHRHVAEMRIFLARAWRRRGVGTHLIQTMLELARRLGLHIIIAQIVASQTHVIKAFASKGFEHKAVLDDYFRLPDGRTQDVVLMVNRLVRHDDEF